MGRHFPPTRQYVLDMVRRLGVEAVYGPDWTQTADETIAALEHLSDRDYMAQCGCDHCDDDGNCLGHDNEATA